MLTNPPVPYDFWVGVPISRLLVGAFSVIVQLHRLIDLRRLLSLSKVINILIRQGLLFSSKQ